jgi:hypothetical protein
MPDLPGISVLPEEERAVHHSTATYAGREGDVDDVIGSAGGASPPLAEDAGPGVVDEEDRQPEPLPERLDDLDEREGDVRRVDDTPATQVQRARRCNTYGQSILPLRQREESLNPGDDRGGDHLSGRPRGRRRNYFVGENIRIGIHQGSAQVGSAEVNGNHGRHRGIQLLSVSVLLFSEYANNRHKPYFWAAGYDLRRSRRPNSGGGWDGYPFRQALNPAKRPFEMEIPNGTKRRNTG